VRFREDETESFRYSLLEIKTKEGGTYTFFFTQSEGPSPYEIADMILTAYNQYTGEDTFLRNLDKKDR
jgi:hypothetical protein